MASSPEVSVVIPTRNSEETIGLCITSIQRQDISTRIIVVDNHSTDSTAEIARRLGAEVYVAGPERSSQRNLAASKTTSPWLLFVDSDMILDRTVASSCLAACRSQNADAAVVPELATGTGFLARCRGLEKICYLGDSKVEAARFFRHDLFDELGGYDEKLYAGEDWDLALRASALGAQITRSDAFIVHWEGRISLRETYSTKKYYGRSLVDFKRKHVEATSSLSPWRSAFLRNWKVLAAQPHFTLGLVVLKFVEYMGVTAGLRQAGN
jgi:glycosyltransferase involved in cell wall biosynthesis